MNISLLRYSSISLDVPFTAVLYVGALYTRHTPLTSSEL